MKTKKQLINEIKNLEFDSYLLGEVDKKLLMDLDVLIMLYLYGIDFDDVIKMCPNINKYKEIVTAIKIKLIQSNNNYAKLLPEDYLTYVSIELMDFYIEKNKLKNTYLVNYDNDWFRNFLLPGFRDLFEKCKNGIPENFDDMCDELLETKINNVTVEEELIEFKKWYKEFEWDSAGLGYLYSDEDDFKHKNK